MIEDQLQQERIVRMFPLLNDAAPIFRDEFFRVASLVQVPKGHDIASEGQPCKQLALLLDGQVRVYKLAYSGREITLYRIDPGNSCVLTASCVMSDQPFPAIAEAETDIEAIIIPSVYASAWMTKSEVWNSFIFGLVSQRLADVIALLEEVAFQRMNVRIASFILAKVQQGRSIKITHNEVAAELGTSREVVSRILKELEHSGLLSVARGEITLLDTEALQRLAERH